MSEPTAISLTDPEVTRRRPMAAETLSRDPLQVMLEMREALEHARTIISAASGLPMPENVSIDFGSAIEEIDGATATAGHEIGRILKQRQAR